ncbi:MAG: ABC transporter ATP-binding protein [Spirochaetes bacterium]|nr:ABC transporter ATP-binding protein [Spirochaetota bacterium]
MPKPLELPEPIRALLDGKGPILLAQSSDLSEGRAFGNNHLVLTEHCLWVAGERAIQGEYPLASIKEVRVDELVGAGRLSVVLQNGAIHALVNYSVHLVPHFAVFARYVNDRVRGTAMELPEAQKSALCAKCGGPLSDRDATCPRCVPRLKILSRLLSLTAPYRGRVFLLMLVTACGVGFQVLPPYITKLIVDEVIGKGQSAKLPMYIGAMAATGLLYLCMRLSNIWLSAWISARVVSDLRRELHTVVQYLRLAFFNKREPGELVGRIMHDTNELLQFLVEGLPFLLINGLLLLAIGVILVRIHWQLAIFVFLPVPVLILGGRWFWKRLIPLFHRQGSTIAHLHSTISESLAGLRVVKAFSQEKRRIDAFEKLNRRLFSTHIGIQRVFGSFNEVMFWVMSLGVALVWLFAVRKITGKPPTMTLGDLLAFVGYIWLFYGPLQWFSAILNWMSHAFTAAERIFEVIDSKPEAYHNPNAVPLPTIRGAIEFRDVRFSYERGKEVLKGMSFAIAPGEVIGLIGKSGSGKSTMIGLLNRFFEADSGEVRIDGVPLRDIPLEQLRRSMGVVMQDPFLFNATIAENIAFGMEHAAFDDIVAAAKAAHAHEFILRKDDGYDTLVGESGAKLSGGEKQRIAIARAILQNPPILILDEATSSVDVDTEKHIQEAIAKLIAGRTTIAIAHRLSTLRNAHRLIVVDNGQIAELGTHEELLAKKGVYAKLAETYTEMNTLRQVVWNG